MSQINRFTPVAGPGSGTVTSLSAGTGITLTPNPITTTGSIALTVPVVIANGGTNATSFTNTDGVVYFDGTRLVDTTVGTAGQVLTSNGAGVAPSFQAVSAGGSVTTLHTQDGNNVTPTVGVINISGGNSLTTTGTAGPNTATISLTGITQYNVQTGGAANALNNVAPTATSGVPLISQGAASQPVFGTAVVAGGGTGAVSFTAHGVILGEGTSPLGVTAAGTTGQVLTGVTGADPVWASPAASSISLTGNTGGALTGNAFTIVTANSTPIFAGAGTTLTLDFALTNNLILGSPGASISTANDTTALGKLAASSISSGQENTFIGYESGVHYTTGSNSTAIGAFSMFSAIGGASNNTTLGYSSLYNLAGIGTGNISIGANSSTAYTTTESNNIIVGNIGIIADSGKIRIGTNGTHTATYIAGIDGVNVGSVAKVVTLASDQLGTATLTAGTNIVITPGANTITIAADTGSASFNYTAVNSSPYVVLTTDYYLGVDSSGGAIQINLPNLPATGRVFAVKDKTGSAATHNITVTTVGGLVNIDGATTYVMNTAYSAIQLMWNGTSYEIW